MVSDGELRSEKNMDKEYRVCWSRFDTTSAYISYIALAY